MDNVVVGSNSVFRRIIAPFAQKALALLGSAIAISGLAGSTIATAEVAPLIIGLIGLAVCSITVGAHMRNIYLREQLISSSGSSDRELVEQFKLSWDIFGEE